MNEVKTGEGALGDLTNVFPPSQGCVQPNSEVSEVGDTSQLHTTDMKGGGGKVYSADV